MVAKDLLRTRRTRSFLFIAGITLFGACLVVAYTRLPTLHNELTFAASVAGGLAAVCSAYYVGHSIRTKVDSDRVANSLELLRQYASAELSQARVRVVKAVDPNSMNPATICKVIRQDRDLAAASSLVICYFESVWIAIRSGGANEWMLYETLRDSLSRCVEILGGYIEELGKPHKSKDIGRGMLELNACWRRGELLSE